MTTDLARWRLQVQRLTAESFPSAVEAVRFLGAVQSQDYGPAKWSIAQRSTGLNDSDLDRLMASGSLLRTHVLRPTWHFVLPEDIHWLLDLTAPRIRRQMAPHDRQVGNDAEVIGTSNRLLASALEGGEHLTRDAIMALFAAGGLPVTGPRLGLLLMHAELSGIISSGAPVGKHQTYALLKTRIPNPRRLSRDEALAELTRRYFTGHGPATVNDFKWWSGLTVAEIKAGLALVGNELLHETIDGRGYWFGAPATPSPAGPVVHLLQVYDEYVVGYSETRVPGALSVERPSINQVLFIDGQVAGRWRRTNRAREVIIEIAFDRALNDAERAGLDAEVARYAAFLGLPVRAVAIGERGPGNRRPSTTVP